MSALNLDSYLFAYYSLDRGNLLAHSLLVGVELLLSVNEVVHLFGKILKLLESLLPEAVEVDERGHMLTEPLWLRSKHVVRGEVPHLGSLHEDGDFAVEEDPSEGVFVEFGIVAAHEDLLPPLLEPVLIDAAEKLEHMRKDAEG